MELYTDDRIMPETFAQPETIDKLLKETEELFSVHFGQSRIPRHGMPDNV